MNKKENNTKILELFQNQIDCNGVVAFNNNGIKRYRVKRIEAGSCLEVEIYPIWKCSKSAREKSVETSRQAQVNLNDKNRKKKIARIINANFTSSDIVITLNYDNEHLPQNIAEAKKNIKNYIRRLENHCVKNNLPKLKFVYTTEFTLRTGKNSGVRVHHHLFVNFSNRDIAEEKWKCGGRTQSRRLQPDEYGLTGLSIYILKSAIGLKAYSCSRNLIPPKVSVYDYKVTKRKVENILKGVVDPKEYFEKIQPGFKFCDMKGYVSDYVDGAYLYVRMHNKDENKKE